MSKGAYYVNAIYSDQLLITYLIIKIADTDYTITNKSFIVKGRYNKCILIMNIF